MFCNFCLPSVVNQSNQNFIWVVFFDTSTALKYRSKIDEISSDYENFRPLFIDGIAELRSVLKKYIESQTTEEDSFVITTRMDNDDMIHEKFIQTIHEISSHARECVIDLRKGYQVNIKRRNAEIRNFKRPFNPFVSVKESVHDFETVIGRMHHDWETFDRVIIEDEEPLWIELIHRKNKFNKVFINLPLTRTTQLHKFAPRQQIIPSGPGYIIFYNVTVFPCLLVFSVAKRVFGINRVDRSFVKTHVRRLYRKVRKATGIL